MSRAPAAVRATVGVAVFARGPLAGDEPIDDAPQGRQVGRRMGRAFGQRLVRRVPTTSSPSRGPPSDALRRLRRAAEARELERCVNELGFHGFLVTGFSQASDVDRVACYDAPQFGAFWSPAAAAALGKPF